MKKQISLFLCLCFVFLLSGCSDRELRNAAWTETYAGYYQAEDGRLYADSVNHAEDAALSVDRKGPLRVPLFSFDSVTGLDGFRENFGGAYIFDFDAAQGENDVSFNKTAEKYDGSFFKNNVLLLIYAEASSGGDRFALDKITDGNGICKLYIEKTRQGATADSSGRFIIVELPRTVAERFTEFDAFIRR